MTPPCPHLESSAHRPSEEQEAEEGGAAESPQTREDGQLVKARLEDAVAVQRGVLEVLIVARDAALEVRDLDIGLVVVCAGGHGVG